MEDTLLRDLIAKNGYVDSLLPGQRHRCVVQRQEWVRNTRDAADRAVSIEQGTSADVKSESWVTVNQAQSSLKSACNSDKDTSSERVSEVTADEEEKSDPDLVLCRLCNKPVVLTQLKNVVEHAKEHYLVKQFECSLCGFANDNQLHVISHAVTQHPNKLPRIVKHKMKVVLISFMVFRMQAGVLHSTDPRDERSANDDKFEEELESGYQKLKGEPNADNTKRLLEQLHKMEPEIKQELSLSRERKAELQEAMQNYVEVKKDNIGEAIEEINEKSKIDRALFQGDMLLTREQAEEVIEDVKENEVKRNKRQAYRDNRYPKALWSNGDGWLSQFTKQSEQTNYNYDLSYDYGGVMHYGATGVVFFKAPDGSKVEVVLDRYQDGVSTDGCRFAGIEIKTGSDKRHTGYRQEFSYNQRFF
ncbi:unnamed protein product [Angiostrongylus costaricensis]|uniref:C2H2-type domain-containing protein n=1 Tax=Angiostrongylus costaricensis TaxID=334426 RepID=A0A158PLV4_ANGCS|nr:unnamed protein product [Angiostrongylus costaricensis]